MAEVYDWKPTRNDNIILTNTSQVILKARGIGENERTMFVIRNTSDDDTKIITLRIGQQGTATANYGIVLKRGELYSENTDNNFKCWQGEIVAICAVASATADLSIFER